MRGQPHSSYIYMYLISKPWILRLRRAPLDLPILAFLCAFLLSFAVTDDRSASFFGVSSRWETGLLALLLLICWYVLLTQYIGRRVVWTKERDWKILLVGLTVLVSFGIMLMTSSDISVLSWRESWNIALGTLFADLKHLVLGSGPGTLSLDAARTGSSGKGFPWIAETLATTGVVGLLGHILLFLASGVFAIHLFRKTKGAFGFLRKMKK